MLLGLHAACVGGTGQRLLRFCRCWGWRRWDARPPFKDIQAAATLAEAGDTVYVTGGLYVADGLKPGHSGSEGRFVVFCPLPGTGRGGSAASRRVARGL